MLGKFQRAMLLLAHHIESLVRPNLSLVWLPCLGLKPWRENRKTEVANGTKSVNFRKHLLWVSVVGKRDGNTGGGIKEDSNNRGEERGKGVSGVSC